MMRKTLIAFSIAAVLGAGAASAAAQDANTPSPPRHGERMAKLDTNKDGRISAEEAKADPKFAEHFARMDVNKDGSVDRADGELRMKQRHDAWFANADTNKDGQLSKAEFDAAKPDRSMHGGRHEGKGMRDRRGGPGAPPSAGEAPAARP